MSKTLSCSLAGIVLTSVLVAGQEGAAQQAKQDAPAVAAPRAAAQLVNVKIDLTITDERDGSAQPPKVVSLVVADRENGRIRTGGSDLQLNVDARPEIVRDGRIRVYLTVEYRPGKAQDERYIPMALTESLAVLLDDGKPLVVSQSADPMSNRSVRVEAKATLLK